MIVTGYKFILAITEDGKLYSWGRNYDGHLGLGHNIDQNSPQMIDFFDGQYVDEIISESFSVFAIVNGRLYSWGSNYTGELGLGHYDNQNLPQLVDFFCDKNIDKIVCGFNYTFAITRDNAVYSWGSNYSGKLGLGNDENQYRPQLVDFFCDKNVGEIICNDHCTFAIVDNGRLYSWGYNSFGNLGLGHNVNQYQPQLVDFFHDKKIDKLICRNNHIFAITYDESVYSWGDNEYGQLGLGHNKNINRPRLVEFFNDRKVDRIICGNGFIFAIMSDGRVYSWGNNKHGELGLGHNAHRNCPQLIDFFQDKYINDIICSPNSIYAIVDNGRLYSWGNNENGHLGLGHNDDQYLPQLVNFFQNKIIDKIICGNFYVFVVDNDGCVYSWGNNKYGELGLGHNNNHNFPQLMNFFQENKICQTRRISCVKSANSNRNI